MKHSRSLSRARVRRAADDLGRDPDDAAAWHELGVALLALDDRAGACAALRQALRLDAGRAGTCLALGALLFDCGLLDAALEFFDRATLRPAIA
jgi:cytochrome c-type biogenesis protein CcmH/NrfG